MSVANALVAQANSSLVAEFTSTKKFPVIEIFGPTIQGEGPLAGSKTMFVRFGGCDFRCKSCDSPHAVNPQAVKAHARRLTSLEIADELLDTMRKTGTRWVTFSGGNPAMWQLDELVALLHQAGKSISVETQGTLSPAWLTQVDVIVVSPKSPGMGENFDWEIFRAFLLKNAEVTTALKVVIFSMQDIEFGLSLQRAMEEDAISQGAYYFSLGNPYFPVLDENLELRNPDGMPTDLTATLLQEARILLEDILIDPRVTTWRFLPQLHVLLWHNEAGR